MNNYVVQPMSMFDREQLYNDNGVPRTKALFVDCGVNKYNILAMNDPDKGYPCLRSLFISLVVDDPSEAEFALTVFGDIHFWSNLQKSPFIRKHLARWRYEADVTRKSTAFKYIVEEVKKDGRNGYQAAKYLVDEPWKPRTKAVKQDSSKSTAAAAKEAHIVDLTDFIRSRKESSS